MTNGKRILVAEDEQAIAEICRRVLASEGFEVDVATNGKRARHLAEENEYDPYLGDIKMPVSRLESCPGQPGDKNSRTWQRDIE